MTVDVKIGDAFGELTVIALHNEHLRGKSWLCQCSCGNKKVLNTSHLIGGKSRRGNRSCGCIQKNRSSNPTKHSRLYGIWYNMKRRCYDTTNHTYPRYGGVGISMCNEWRNDFDKFCEWALKNGYEEDLTIDRINSIKSYSPENCRWATYFTQMQNRKMQKSNTSGVEGAELLNDGRYRVTIARDKKRYGIGTYATLEESQQARDKAIEFYEENGTLEGYKPVWKRLRKASGK